ncbi:MAG: intradiol ring-cleavage dioxygenase [Micropepsaceae bacterium]
MHDHGLSRDLATIIARRRILHLGGVAATGALLSACGFGPPGQSEPNRTGKAADGSTCIKIPAETNGPFPADGSNARNGATLNVLTQSGIARSDLRTSFAGMTAVAEGAQLDLTITLVDVAKACAPLANHVVYAWHCDALGKYSLYEIEDRNYLRGIGVTDASGQVKFTTVFPGCYAGRTPHIHFEVFANLTAATGVKNSLLTSQLAMPGDVSKSLYTTNPLYAASVANLAGSPLDRDGIFADNTAEQLTAMTPRFTGDATTGFQAAVTIGITTS